MGLVFEINQELALISVTATELLSITRAIAELVTAPAFRTPFDDIVAQINKSYAVVDESFAPFDGLDDEERFALLFDERHAAFKGRYLLDVSKPRRYCDSIYDAYIAMKQTKQAKSTFPPLQRSLARLEVFYDKWITNDAFLAMSIDGAVKLQNRLLNEIADIKHKDAEYACSVLASAWNDFRDYLALIRAKSRAVDDVVASSAGAAIAAVPAVGV